MEPFIQLYREARRRKVFRTAALYVLGTWAALQVADVLFPGFGIPDAAIQALVWAAVLGFPVALVFGWLFEIGAGGIRRTLPRGAGESSQPQPLAQRDYLLLAAFAMVATVLVVRAVQEVRDTPATADEGAAAVARNEVARLANSIAVLPFSNISRDAENEYFCDGISEEILNKLSHVRQLNVIGRTSSFAFKGSNTGIEQISAVLGVRYVLQGSVRKAGEQLRISAQLLDEQGRQLWTQTFDRKLANVFDIQDEIAQAVAAMVADRVVASPEMAHRPNLEAYDRYLTGRELLHRRDIAGAMTVLARAIELDPDFAEAHAEWAIARLIGYPTDRDLDAAAAAINRALELQPQLLRAQAGRGLWSLQSTPPDAAAAEAILRDVLARDPNTSDALLWLATSLAHQGRGDEGFEILRRAHRVDPLHPSIAGSLSADLMAQGKEAEAMRILERQLQQPNPGSTIFTVVRDILRQRGELVEMNAVAKDQALRAGPQYFSLALSYALLGNISAAEYWIERLAKDFPDWTFNPYFRAIVPHWQGDAEVALQRFQQGADAAGIRIKDQIPFIRIWYGALLARSGQHAAAIEVLEPLASTDAMPQSLNLEVAPEFDGWHALAWSYRHTGMGGKATAILSELLDQCRLQVDDPRSPPHGALLHYCAETALLAGDADRAVALLERAVAAGWRDYYVRQNDPYWSVLTNDPRYRALMATVKADVDRQRAEVERIDASDDFIAKIDAAMTERRKAGSQ